jgi:REP element-mobilizing transposase RayT
MSIPCEFPPKCLECAKLKGPILNRKCNLCQDLGFCESVLCDLNRCVQNPADFECHAFQPILRLAKPSGSGPPDLSGGLRHRPRRESILGLLDSDKIKYDTALALQKLDRDPDGVFVNIKYHLAWNVVERRPVFKRSDDYLVLFHDTFSQCGEIVGGGVSLLWLAPDHIHVYIESDGENSVETIIHGLNNCQNVPLSDNFMPWGKGLAQGRRFGTKHIFQKLSDDWNVPTLG